MIRGLHRSKLSYNIANGDINRAIDLYNQINGYSNYYSNMDNWTDIQKIYFIGNEGFMVLKKYANNYDNIWLICYQRTNIIIHLMSELAKDTYGNKTYLITGNNGIGPLSNHVTLNWFQSMSFDVIHNGSTIMLQLEGKSLRNKFLFNTG